MNANHREPVAHHLGDPRQRPALVLIPSPHGRAGFQHRLQLTHLRRAQLARATTGPFRQQRRPAASGQRPPPPVRRHPGHPEPPGHLPVAVSPPPSGTSCPRHSTAQEAVTSPVTSGIKDLSVSPVRNTCGSLSTSRSQACSHRRSVSRSMPHLATKVSRNALPGNFRPSSMSLRVVRPSVTCSSRANGLRRPGCPGTPGRPGLMPVSGPPWGLVVSGFPVTRPRPGQHRMRQVPVADTPHRPGDRGPGTDRPLRRGGEPVVLPAR